jgi:hypothetical protein
VCRYPKCGAQRFNITHSFRCEQDIKASGGKRNKENERVKKKKKNICKRNRNEEEQETYLNNKRLSFQARFFSFFLMKAGPSFNIYPVQTPYISSAFDKQNKTKKKKRAHNQEHHQ